MRRRIALWLIRLSVRIDSSAVFVLCCDAADDPSFQALRERVEIVRPPIDNQTGE